MSSEGQLINLVVNKHSVEVEARGQDEAQLSFYCKKQEIHQYIFFPDKNIRIVAS